MKGLDHDEKERQMLEPKLFSKHLKELITSEEKQHKRKWGQGGPYRCPYVPQLASLQKGLPSPPWEVLLFKVVFACVSLLIILPSFLKIAYSFTTAGFPKYDYCSTGYLFLIKLKGGSCHL